MLKLLSTWNRTDTRKSSRFPIVTALLPVPKSRPGISNPLPDAFTHHEPVRRSLGEGGSRTTLKPFNASTF